MRLSIILTMGGISVFICITAVLLAIRMIRVTGKHRGWFFLGLAVIVTAIYNLIFLYHLLNFHFPDDRAGPFEVTFGFINLFISIFIAAGIFYLRPLFAAMMRAEAALRESEKKYISLLGNIPDVAFTCDEKGQICFISSNVQRICGYTAEEMDKEGLRFWENNIHPDDLEKLTLAYKTLFKEGNPIDIECRLRKKSGEWIWLHTLANSVYKKQDVLYTDGIFTEITERKTAEEKLRQLWAELISSNTRFKQLALIDSQTGLYNYRYLEKAIEAEFERAHRSGHPLSVMMLDVDYFKSINDVYGHAFGDTVLKQLAGQLMANVRRYNSVVRYGGEEFIIISPDTYKSDILNLAHRLLDILTTYDFGDKEHTVKLKLSIAIASYPDDIAVNGMALVGVADQILNKVKESGGNRVYSSSDINRESRISLTEPTDVKFLKEKMDNLTKRANQSIIEAIFAFAKTIELKDHYTGEHVECTVHYATKIAEELKLPRYDIELIRHAAVLHDLGKIGISENILLKKAKLIKEEIEEIKKHPQIAADILRPMHFLQPLIPLILYHHERWDGQGYPSGLKGKQIPMGARVIAIADVYQALISDRPYRKGYSEREASDMIKNGSGTQFCPQVVEAFISVLQQRNEL